MSELYKFVTSNKKFELVVKSEFLKKCPKPEDFTDHDLLTIYKVNQFFNNPMGPAITRLRDGYSEYWIDGKKLSEEEGKRIAHSHAFNSKLMNEVSDNPTPTETT